MSGICGIVHLDASPVDDAMLRAMTDYMVFRGPDAKDVWLSGAVGLGHTLLRTTFEAAHEQQPCSLDGQVWITADARVDGQGELKQKLLAGHRQNLDGSTDSQLILHAYHVWGQDCVKHLIGDFAFAIWDGPRQQLFCARDHFGIKPFFYACLGNRLVISNTLNCIRMHPAVSAKLNDLAIADFLLFESNQDSATTAFADIQRLPPAHTLTWSAATEVQVNCYWSLPTDLGVRPRPTGDYVEQFRKLLDMAVADRIRADAIGIEMSGGLDSTSIAAVAKAVLLQRQRAFELQAVTVVFDHLIPDKERHYVTLAAEHLGIPIHYIQGDHYPLYGRRDQPETRTPEPSHNPTAALSADAYRVSASLGRVFLTGWDGDALLSESLRPHFRSLARSGRYMQLAGELLLYIRSQRKQVVPPRWRAWLKSLFFGASTGATSAFEGISSDGYPDWLSPDLEARFDLRARWQRFKDISRADHPTRPYAYGVYQYFSRDACIFERYDAGNTGLPLEYRHPLMDLRLMEYCLALPLQPWVVKKHILRQAMRGVLPEAIRVRPKTPLAGLPYVELLKCAPQKYFAWFIPSKGLAKFVNVSMIPAVDQLHRQQHLAWIGLRPLSLDKWLRSSQVTH